MYSHPVSLHERLDGPGVDALPRVRFHQVISPFESQSMWQCAAGRAEQKLDGGTFALGPGRRLASMSSEVSRGSMDGSNDGSSNPR